MNKLNLCKVAQINDGQCVYRFQPGEPRTRNLFGTDARKPA
jgi:hypothetical protein